MKAPSLSSPLPWIVHRGNWKEFRQAFSPLWSYSRGAWADVSVRICGHTLGHAYGVRVQKVQRVQRVVVAASPQIKKKGGTRLRRELCRRIVYAPLRGQEKKSLGLTGHWRSGSKVLRAIGQSTKRKVLVCYRLRTSFARLGNPLHCLHKGKQESRASPFGNVPFFIDNLQFIHFMTAAYLRN